MLILRAVVTKVAMCQVVKLVNGSSYAACVHCLCSHQTILVNLAVWANVPYQLFSSVLDWILSLRTDSTHSSSFLYHLDAIWMFERGRNRFQFQFAVQIYRPPQKNVNGCSLQIHNEVTAAGVFSRSAGLLKNLTHPFQSFIQQRVAHWQICITSPS